MIEARRARGAFETLMREVSGCFARTAVWWQAWWYVLAVLSDLPKRNGWTIARWIGDTSPDKTQRLLNRAQWDAEAVLGAVRAHVVAGLDAVAPARSLRIGALDESGQCKQGTATAGVKRQHMGCAGRVANGINTVYLNYIRGGVGHAIIGFRQWIPREQLADTTAVARMGLPGWLRFATKGQLAVQILKQARRAGVAFDFICADEVYGNSPDLRTYCQRTAQAYILRVPSTFTVPLPSGATMTAGKLVKTYLHTKRKRWTIMSAGAGDKGDRLYQWAWFATASPRHWLLVRKHTVTGELAHHYCWVPPGAPATLKRLVTAAGLRWPIEEDFEFSKDLFGLDQSQVRLYDAIRRHTVLVTAALAVCAVTAATARARTDTRAPDPTGPDDIPPTDPGHTPLTVAAIKTLINILNPRRPDPEHDLHWLDWTRRHRARAAWFHKRTRLRRHLNPPYPQVT